MAGAWATMDLPQLHPDAMLLPHPHAHLQAGETLSEILATVPIEILTCIVQSRVSAGQRLWASGWEDGGGTGSAEPAGGCDAALPAEMRWCIPAQSFGDEGECDLAASARLHYQEV